MRRFGYLARKIRATHPPRLLSKSFADALKPREMANPNRLMGKHRQEAWMEEDDLLGADLGHEQDLQRQLQKGGRVQPEPSQAGFKGRRLEQGDGIQERPGGGRFFNQGRFDPRRQQSQQGAGSATIRGIGTNSSKGRGTEESVIWNPIGVVANLLLKVCMQEHCLMSNAFVVWEQGIISLNVQRIQCVISANKVVIWLWIAKVARNSRCAVLAFLARASMLLIFQSQKSKLIRR